MKFPNPLQKFSHIYKKMSNFGKILLFVSILLILIVFFNSIHKNLPVKEGYQQNDQFLFLKGSEVYDSFYAGIYDYLVYNSVKDNYEIGEIVNKTSPNTESIILDVGSGTGHHVAELNAKNLNVIGIDISPEMIAKAKENYPNYNFITGDVLKQNQFKSNSFTHIVCLYFTLYYFQDKQLFFNNCMEWLKPGGYLIIHVVNRDTFDPILPPGNPLYIVSPQKYAKERITHTKVHFNDFVYSSNFELNKKEDVAIFNEKFKFKNGKVRKQEHTLYMESTPNIIDKAQLSGFIVEGQIDLIKCAYENQYLYVLVKPS